MLASCEPPRHPPPRWHSNTIYQAASSTTFGAHHRVRYRYNGFAVDLLSSACGADNWYSGLRYTGTCSATVVRHHLHVRWHWVWTKGSPPTSRSQAYECDYDVDPAGTIRRRSPGFLALRCPRFDP